MGDMTVTTPMPRDLLAEGAYFVGRANEQRAMGDMASSDFYEEVAADRISLHNAVTPTEAPDAELPDGDEDITEGVDQDDVDDLPADPDAPGPWDQEDLT